MSCVLTVLTDDQIKEVETLAPYLTAEQIAGHLGVARQTFFDIKKRDERVELAFQRGKSKAVATVAKNLVQRANSGSDVAAIFYLKTRGGWKETQAVEHTSPDGSMTPKTLDDFYKINNAPKSES